MENKNRNGKRKQGKKEKKRRQKTKPVTKAEKSINKTDPYNKLWLKGEVKEDDWFINVIKKIGK